MPIQDKPQRQKRTSNPCNDETSLRRSQHNLDCTFRRCTQHPFGQADKNRVTSLLSHFRKVQIPIIGLPSAWLTERTWPCQARAGSLDPTEQIAALPYILSFAMFPAARDYVSTLSNFMCRTQLRLNGLKRIEVVANPTQETREAWQDDEYKQQTFDWGNCSNCHRNEKRPNSLERPWSDIERLSNNQSWSETFPWPEGVDIDRVNTRKETGAPASTKRQQHLIWWQLWGDF